MLVCTALEASDDKYLAKCRIALHGEELSFLRCPFEKHWLKVKKVLWGTFFSFFFSGEERWRRNVINLRTGMWKECIYLFILLLLDVRTIRMIQWWNICLEMFTVADTACYQWGIISNFVPLDRMMHVKLFIGYKSIKNMI